MCNHTELTIYGNKIQPNVAARVIRTTPTVPQIALFPIGDTIVMCLFLIDYQTQLEYNLSGNIIIMTLV